MNVEILHNLSGDYYVEFNNCLIHENMKIVNKNKNINLENFNSLSLILVPEGFRENLQQGLLKDRHYRSIELTPEWRNDTFGNSYSARRIKGAGKYGSPNLNKKHTFMNIKDDQTGFVLGLLDAETSERSFLISEILLKNTIEAELPEISFKLENIYFEDEHGGDIIPLKEALFKANIPLEKIKTDYVIQIDALGSNYRLQDIMTPLLFKNSFKTCQTTLVAQVLKEVIDFLNQEQHTNHLILNIENYINIFSKRLLINLGKLHSLNAIHGRLTPHNICMDGRLIDIDTIKGLIEINFNCNNELLQKDIDMLHSTLYLYYKQIAITLYPGDFEAKIKQWCSVTKQNFKYYEQLTGFYQDKITI
ncbi:hypothetical protein [Bacillus pseudomycoides]|uniref:hypothetical protein n=1 Tax=Bacillus pseudomycoides TaxID=64104 RepID=UPI000BF7CCAF|nr:hypothetical protein [Bacillus pseudomycoides]PGD73701.1 hypothetical protein COM46_21725 [Bacillus pseudomycoides]